MTTTVGPTRDQRLVGSATLALVFVAVALLFGRPIVAVAAIPFAVGVWRSVGRLDPVDVDVRVAASSFSPLEGDRVTMSLTVERSPTRALQISVVPEPAWADLDPDELVWFEPPGTTEVTVRFAATAVQWGHAGIGSVIVDHIAPGGLVHWQTTVKLTTTFRVLPPPERVREILMPPVSSSTVGQHPSRLVGDGFDFAELRPYAQGDRLRDINWRATARADVPIVNRRHPERNGDVVLLLDTFTDATGGHSETLQAVVGRAGRAAWAVAQLHLGHQDRVGLATRGRVLRQLRPGSGDRARHTLLETLLSVGGQVASGEVAFEHGARAIPATALVIAFTPLIDNRMTDDLLALAHTHRVAVVAVDLADAVPKPANGAERAAQRLYAAQLQLQRDRLTAEGIPLTVWRDDSSLAMVIATLRRLQRSKVVRA